MATTGYPVAQLADGTGCTASTLRHIISEKYECTGVIGGLAVTGGTTLAYVVAAGVAVCSKGRSDGFTECYFAGGNTPAVAAADATNPRIDAVWLTSHDAPQGDADNAVTLGVTQGNPAATPTAPTIPTYATLLGEMLVPAGATTTAKATRTSSINYAIPYGASLGVVLDQTDTSNADITTEYCCASGHVFFQTDRLVSIKMTFTCSAVGGPWTGGEGSVYVRVVIDGTTRRAFEVRTWPTFAGSQYFEDCEQLAAGNHVVAVYIRPGVSRAKRYYAAGSWAGQHVQVVDAGVVR